MYALLQKKNLRNNYLIVRVDVTTDAVSQHKGTKYSDVLYDLVKTNTISKLQQCIVLV